MVVTTGDIKQNYEIKGIVRFYLSGMFAKQETGTALFNEQIDVVIEKHLIPQAEMMEADAIVGLVIAPFTGNGMSASVHNTMLYGTAVKLITDN
jgi:hypothetical protein